MRGTGTTNALALAVLIMLLVMVTGFRVCAQSSATREMRGVWLTTLSGLDWPSAAARNDPDAQRSSLRRILDDVARKNMNTVFFQVRSRGNAMYASSIEPWAGELTGTLGASPGWDPLAFAVDECHRRGLEIHAWVNVFKVWSGESLPGKSSPAHVQRSHPEWVRAYKNEQWIDPGIPEARTWLVDLIADMAARYDIDGVQMDYTRYPESDFADADTYRRYGKGVERAQWRRENVSAFVRDLSTRLKSIKPRLELGAAPIGIYTNITGVRGWEGLNAVSQDSRHWLESGWIDYVCPQVYWGLKRRGSTIDFERIVRDWVRHRSGRNVYIGMAPYKEQVARWLHEHIDACRNEHAQGEAYFRYEHIRDNASFKDRYALPAIAPSMPWRDETRPNPPRNLTVARAGGSATLQWLQPFTAADGETASRYAIYRLESGRPTPMPVAIVPSQSTSWRDDRSLPGCEYAVTALDRVRNESSAASSVAIAMDRIPAPSYEQSTAAISDAVQAPGNLLLVAYSVPTTAFVRIRLMDNQGAELVVMVDDVQNPGSYVLGIDRSAMPVRTARVVFECGDERSYKDLRLE